MDIQEFLAKCTGFDWDEHNVRKNWNRHKVSPFESEQVFFNQPLIVADDPKHSQTEKRFLALGRTDQGRKLFIAFTVRRHQLRVICSRDMSRKERRIYEAQKEKNNT